MIRVLVICLAMAGAVAAFDACAASACVPAATPAAAGGLGVVPSLAAMQKPLPAQLVHSSAPSWRLFTFTQPARAVTFARALELGGNPYTATERGASVMVAFWAQVTAISLLVPA